MNSRDINYVVLNTLDGEKYVFVFSNDRIEELIETIWRFVNDPGLGFTICDAVRVGESLKELLGSRE